MDDSTRKERISIHELMRLFGRYVNETYNSMQCLRRFANLHLRCRVHEDENGVPFIFAHEDDSNDADDNSSHFTPPPRAADHASDDEGDGMDDDV